MWRAKSGGVTWTRSSTASKPKLIRRRALRVNPLSRRSRPPSRRCSRSDRVCPSWPPSRRSSEFAAPTRPSVSQTGLAALRSLNQAAMPESRGPRAKICGDRPPNVPVAGVPWQCHITINGKATTGPCERLVRFKRRSSRQAWHISGNRRNISSVLFDFSRRLSNASRHANCMRKAILHFAVCYLRVAGFLLLDAEGRADIQPSSTGRPDVVEFFRQRVSFSDLLTKRSGLHCS